MILQRPGIGLAGALRIGMAAVVEQQPADGIVADQRHQLLQRLAVEALAGEALALRNGDAAG